MIRIGVYNGDTHKRGLTLHNFTVIKELEDTESPIDNFGLVGRYLDFKERLMKNRIYLVNIQDEDPTKPIVHYEVLDKAKFIKYVDGDYIITYKRYAAQNMVDLYEARNEEFQDYLDWVVKRGKEEDGQRTRLNTFTKSIIERVFRNYGYNNVMRYDDKTELKKWQKSILKKVKAFNKKRADAKTNWSEEEIELLILEMAKAPRDRMSEKDLAKRLGRTVPSIATKKWKLKSENYKSKYLNMNDRAKLISEKLKSFREEKGWSQGTLSKNSGVSLSIVNQLECMNYNNTDTAKVKILLDYLDKNSEKIILTDLPSASETSGQETKAPKKNSKRKSLEVVTESKKEDTPTPVETSPIPSDLVGEVRNLSQKIENVLRSHVNLQIENKTLKNDKENLLKALTNYISEHTLESEAI